MERLIELVRREQCLYDTSLPEYNKKTLKDSLWTKIAEELKYKNGEAAKDAWLRLRNCHRDAIRRRNKLYKTGVEVSNVRPWKLEKQMEFLTPYMTSRAVDASADPLSHEVESNRSEDGTDYPEVRDIERKDTSRQGSSTGGSREWKNKPLIMKHEKRAKARAEKRKVSDDSDDDLQQFFNNMYTSTKKMPALSQHKLKRKIFNLVSDEEEYLLTKETVAETTPPFDPVIVKAYFSDDEYE